jgi:V-type H+-transporting ATPase subunit C
MPSDQSTWLIAIPHDGDAEGTLQELHTKLVSQSKATPGLAQLNIPSFKV